MHRIKRNTYVGQPGELVQVTTITHNGGRVRLLLDGNDLGNTRRFSLPRGAGAQRDLRIDLAGPVGASCGIGIAPVDGGTDGDFLLCQPFNPQPGSDYSFQVAGEASVVAFGSLKATSARAVIGRNRRKSRKADEEI